MPEDFFEKNIKKRTLLLDTRPGMHATSKKMGAAILAERGMHWVRNCK